MKLYYAKGACSIGPHVALREAEADFDLVPVDLRNKALSDGRDYLTINPKGYVPMLERDDGQSLTECAAILQFVADQYPGKALAPAAGTDERYRLQEWLSFVGSELHKGLTQMFLPTIPADMRPVARTRLTARMKYLDQALEGKQWLMGDSYTVADAYCGGVLRWTETAKYDLSDHPNIASYYTRFGERDAVKAAIAAEA